MKRIIRSGIAILLTLTVLINSNITLIEAHALDAGKSAKIVAAQSDNWNSAELLLAEISSNALPEHDSAGNLVRACLESLQKRKKGVK